MCIRQFPAKATNAWNLALGAELITSQPDTERVESFKGNKQETLGWQRVLDEEEERT